MKNIHNFCAGPCLLPQTVYEQASQAILNFEHTGMSILSISHRSKAFLAVLEEARALSLELLGLQNKGYVALFLQGGASMEFLRVPYNLMRQKAGYINTGTWSAKAIEQAQLMGEVSIVASSEDQAYTYIPKEIHVEEALDYLHFTSNNTIYGTQFNYIPKTNAPLVCDMSSDIYSREFAYDQLDLIYAGAQKNIGPAGVSLILVKEEILGKTQRLIPQMMDYQEHINTDSLYHTANVFAVYTCLLNFRWLKQQGGVAAIERVNNQKAALLYQTIDQLDFVNGVAAVEDRSKMNVTFRFAEEQMNQVFDQLCTQANIENVKGHRSVGGYRASLYNAVPLESVAALTTVMHQMKTKV
ncbi:3-phosphoserine/phosphohydroxythreonine transaminase [Myroides sp. DF42-4-2]|uniref:3-phosphoserine/phosphohydroxythreonine transaminase n=1 Tax=unclassified Myroides TaxID=2642485 RepID=UPI002577E907|nr:3-phosphoserine/phosphohydroxythreonine transaminase [Myroides sp. DF42-4-2]MDM1408384.1 3-phosphoserine/phosphohydroxythreonine transaminase [Myroides sp. DF42-4-2]